MSQGMQELSSKNMPTDYEGNKINISTLDTTQLFTKSCKDVEIILDEIYNYRPFINLYVKKGDTWHIISTESTNNNADGYLMTARVNQNGTGMANDTSITILSSPEPDKNINIIDYSIIGTKCWLEYGMYSGNSPKTDIIESDMVLDDFIDENKALHTDRKTYQYSTRLKKSGKYFESGIKSKLYETVIMDYKIEFNNGLIQYTLTGYSSLCTLNNVEIEYTTKELIDLVKKHPLPQNTISLGTHFHSGTLSPDGHTKNDKEFTYKPIELVYALLKEYIDAYELNYEIVVTDNIFKHWCMSNESAYEPIEKGTTVMDAIKRILSITRSQYPEQKDIITYTGEEDNPETEDIDESKSVTPPENLITFYFTVYDIGSFNGESQTPDEFSKNKKIVIDCATATIENKDDYAYEFKWLDRQYQPNIYNDGKDIYGDTKSLVLSFIPNFSGSVVMANAGSVNNIILQSDYMKEYDTKLDYDKAKASKTTPDKTTEKIMTTLKSAFGNSDYPVSENVINDEGIIQNIKTYVNRAVYFNTGKQATEELAQKIYDIAVLQNTPLNANMTTIGIPCEYSILTKVKITPIIKGHKHHTEGIYYITSKSDDISSRGVISTFELFRASEDVEKVIQRVSRNYDTSKLDDNKEYKKPNVRQNAFKDNTYYDIFNDTTQNNVEQKEYNEKILKEKSLDVTNIDTKNIFI